MFTGIIKNIASLKAITSIGDNKLFTIDFHSAASLSIDQSIAHDGVCLTVTRVGEQEYDVIAVPETLNITTLDQWIVGQEINIEFAMRAESLFDGHMVQGHVDDIAQCIDIEVHDQNWIFKWRFNQRFSNLIVNKGSVCLNGISLTVIALNGFEFCTTIIPYTFENTNLKTIKPGDYVNIEFDIIGKYLAKYLENRTDFNLKSSKV